MITDYEVKRAMNRLANAGYPRPADPEGALQEWKTALMHKNLNAMPDEVDRAVTTFIRTTEKTYGPPRPAQIKSLIIASRDAKGYTEPGSDAPKATQQQRRSIWEQHLPPELMQRIKRRNGP